MSRRVAPIMLGRSILGDPARKPVVAGFMETMSARRDIWRAVNGVIDRPGIFDELSRIRAETLILVGDEDVATPRPKAEKIRGAISGAKLEIVPHAGHSSTVEEPARVTEAIGRFLGS